MEQGQEGQEIPVGETRPAGSNLPPLLPLPLHPILEQRSPLGRHAGRITPPVLVEGLGKPGVDGLEDTVEHGIPAGIDVDANAVGA